MKIKFLHLCQKCTVKIFCFGWYESQTKTNCVSGSGQVREADPGDDPGDPVGTETLPGGQVPLHPDDLYGRGHVHVQGQEAWGYVRGTRLRLWGSPTGRWLLCSSD